jgi:hypothetical protein
VFVEINSISSTNCVISLESLCAFSCTQNKRGRQSELCVKKKNETHKTRRSD